MKQAVLARATIREPRSFQIPFVLIALVVIVALGLLIQQSASTRMALLFVTGQHAGAMFTRHYQLCA